MEDLIPIMNKLHEVLGVLGNIDDKWTIDLPQIAVVGAQSVGKSSVLEALVGRDFLPRGTGIITRCPLLLQLRFTFAKRLSGYDDAKTQEGSSGAQADEWAEFGHKPGVKWYDFEAVRNEIQHEMERITGIMSCISSEPIIIKVFSPRVVDLTLVDLPGITKVPIGDQPQDIEQQVRNMILQYIKRPSCIILAVTAANTDLANSDALKLARDVDPFGSRTIGVITKCDTLEVDAPHAADLLSGNIYPLKLGYVGVVCRNQRDIYDNKDMSYGLKTEERFFENHPSYKDIAHKCGIKYLSRRLNNVLTCHIRDALPELKNKISSLLRETDKQLAAVGDPILEGMGNPGVLLLHCFSKFARNFQDAIDGKVPMPCQTISSYLVSQAASGDNSNTNSTLNNSILLSQLTGGARINYIFHDWFAKHIWEFDPLENLSDHEIRTAIRNSTGPKAALFVPEGAFEILVKKQIQQLESPSLQCVEQVYIELQRIVENCEMAEICRFTVLRERILDVVKGVLKKCLNPTNQMVQSIIQIELAYINTNHVDFLNHKSFPNLFNSGEVQDFIRQKAQDPVLHSGQLGLNMSNYGMNSSSVSNASRSNSNSKSVSNQVNPQQMIAPGVFGLLSCVKNSHNSMGSDSSMSSTYSLYSNTIPSFYDNLQSTSHLLCSSYMMPGKSVRLKNVSSMNGLKLPKVPPIVIPSENPSEREIIETQLIKSLIWSYFNIVKKNITDAVPKSIMYFMVNTAKDVIQRELVSQLYKEELFPELLKESADVVEKRFKCKETHKLLRQSWDILGQIRDISWERGG